MMSAAPASTSEFIDLLFKSGLIDESRRTTLGNLPDEPATCAATLVTRGVLTKFQARLLLNGKHKGFKLGAYIIREQIGQGGMGTVYLAEHETLRRRVALKVLTPPKQGNTALCIERFLREARAVAALDHPNIVRLHDVGKQGDTHYIVMEYVEGQTLEEIVTQSGPISASKAVGYIAQAAAGLQHASEKGIIHRDIKPANLILGRDGTIKILDMGLARPTDEGREQLTEMMDKDAIVGTADFLSPEQAMNSRLDSRSDIYSLGATFYAVVTGQPPFSGNTTQKLIQHQLKDAPTVATMDKTFPAGLSDVVAKMLSKKPENRYQTPAEIITALAPWLSEQTSGRLASPYSGTGLAVASELVSTISEFETDGTKRMPPVPSSDKSKPRRKRWLMPAVAVGLLVAIGGIVAAIASGFKKTDTVTAAKSGTDAPRITPPDTVPVTVPNPKPEPEKVEIATASGPVLYEMDLSQQKFFLNRGKGVVNTETGIREWVTDPETETRSLPKGWHLYTFKSDSVVETAARVLNGQPVIGFCNFAGSNSGVLCTPQLRTRTGKVTLSLEYTTEDSSSVTSASASPNPLRKNHGTSARWQVHRPESGCASVGISTCKAAPPGQSNS